MDWAYLLNSFDGRIGRQTFWIAFGVVMVAEIFGHYIAEQIQGDRLSAIVDLAFTYPEFAIAAKRGQDRNMPLWLIGAFFAAGVLLDLLTVLGLAGTDEAPSPISLIIAVPFTVFGLALSGRARLPQGHDRGRTATARTRLGPQGSPPRRSDLGGLTGARAAAPKSVWLHDRRSRRHRPRSSALPLGDAGGRRRAGLFAGRAGEGRLRRASHDVRRARHRADRESLRPHRHGKAQSGVRRAYRRGAAGR